MKITQLITHHYYIDDHFVTIEEAAQLSYKFEPAISDFRVNIHCEENGTIEIGSFNTIDTALFETIKYLTAHRCQE